MKRIHLAAGTLCALLMIGCNRESSDQGGTGSDARTGAGGNAGNPQPQTEVGTPTPSPASPSTEPRTDPNNAPPAADNTGRNVRDRSDATLTPGDQGDSESDIELTRRIRQAIVKNDQLSATAKNIKIIAANGKVTLRGPVNSEAERQQIVEAARSVEGITSVDDQLEVKTTN